MLLKLYVLLVTLQLLDAYTTYKVLKAGGREMNPVLLKLIVLLKPHTNAKWAWLAFAKIFAVAVGWLLFVMNQPEALAVVCVFYVYVVIHNFLEMKKNGI